MKLPNGQQPPTPQISAATRSAPTSKSSQEATALSARQQLDQIPLANRETLLARVAEVINRQGQNSPDLLLDIRGRPVQVNAAIGSTELSPGDWVKLMRTGNELQLMGKLADTPQAAINAALAQRMPWQQSLDSGLARLISALNQGTAAELAPGQLPGSRSLQPLPAAARQALESLLSRLPVSNNLVPGAGTQNTSVQQVRQWVAESGLFAESRLTRSPSPALPDLKLAIGRIITSLLAERGGDPVSAFNRLTPLASPELVQAPLQFPRSTTTAAPSASADPDSTGQTLRLLAGMLNRITVNQLHSQILSARAGGEGPAPSSTMLLDLPWVTPQNEPGIAQLRIEQHTENEGSESNKNKARAATASEWHLNLAIDLELAGTLNFEVSLRHQEVSARVWAEKQETLKKVNAELPLLRRSLTELGLEVTNLEPRRGSPAAPITKLEHRLVDTRA